MKKLILILVMCFAAFAASAQCPPLNLVQNAKWKFVFSQCMQDTLNCSYVDTSKIAYFDAYGNLTTITYAALLDSLNVPAATPSGNNHNIQFNASGAFGSSTDFNYDAFNGVFYIYDSNGDTLFSIKTNTREIRNFGRVFLPNKPDSSVFFSGAGGELQVDSVNFVWNDAANSLRLGPFVNGFATSQRFVITGTSAAQSTFRIGCIGNAGSAVPTIEFFRARGTTTTPTVLTLGSVLGELNFGGYNGSAFGASATAIRGIAGGTWTTSAQPTYLSFSTGDDNGATFTSYITKKGTLSILGGPSDTTYTLDVHGTAAITQTARNYDLNDSLLTKDDSTGEVRAWLPLKHIALKNDTNTFRALQVNGVITGTSNFTAGAAAAFEFTGRSGFRSNANGNLTLLNNGGNDFSQLMFGGTTSAFPSIKRQGQVFRLLLADTSGYAALQTGQLSVNGIPDASAAVTINSTTQGFLPPVMTAAQGSAIATPAQGLMIFVTTTNGTFTAVGWWGFDGTNWVQIG